MVEMSDTQDSAESHDFGQEALYRKLIDKYFVEKRLVAVEEEQRMSPSPKLLHCSGKAGEGSLSMQTEEQNQQQIEFLLVTVAEEPGEGEPRTVVDFVDQIVPSIRDLWDQPTRDYYSTKMDNLKNPNMIAVPVKKQQQKEVWKRAAAEKVGVGSYREI